METEIIESLPSVVSLHKLGNGTAYLQNCKVRHFFQVMSLQIGEILANTTSHRMQRSYSLCRSKLTGIKFFCVYRQLFTIFPCRSWIVGRESSPEPPKKVLREMFSNPCQHLYDVSSLLIMK